MGKIQNITKQPLLRSITLFCFYSEAKASMMDCCVCFESYEEIGDHVPRLLPCSHTLCEKCLSNLITGGNSLNCPECRIRHPATNGVKSFPQNKYILQGIRRGDNKIERCNEHNKDKDIYCKDQHCQKAICSLCLVKEHTGHEIVDIVEKITSDTLFERIQSATKDLQAWRTNILFAKDMVDKRNESCLEMVNGRKDALTKRIAEKYEVMEKDVSEQLDELNKNIKEEVAKIDSHLVELEIIQENTKRFDTFEEINGKLSKINAKIESGKSNLSKSRLYNCYDYTEENDIEGDVINLLCGSISRQVVKVDPTTPDQVMEVAEEEAPGHFHIDLTRRPILRRFTCKGKIFVR